MNSKYKKRAVHNLFWQFIQPFTNLAAAALIVRLGSLELWGDMVSLMIVLHLLLTFTSWGSKEYVLRGISRSPAKMKTIISANISDRLWLLLILIPAVYFLPLNMSGKLAWLVWGVGIFLTRSLEPIIYFRQNYHRIWPLEALLSVILLVSIITFSKELSTETIVFLFAFIAVSRAVFYVLLLNTWYIFKKPRIPRFSYLKRSLSFFLLDASGILNSRIDLYFSLWLLPPEQLAIYQIFTAMLIHSQSLANALYRPLVKPAYRVSVRVAATLQRNLWQNALWIVPLVVTAIFIVTRSLYNLPLSAYYFLAGMFFVFPVYVYLPFIYRLFSTDRQSQVMLAGFSGGLLKALLIFLLFPHFGMFGLLVSAMIVQWILFPVYAILAANIVSEEQTGQSLTVPWDLKNAS